MPPSSSTSSLISTLVRKPSNLFASLQSSSTQQKHGSSTTSPSIQVAIFDPSRPTPEGCEHDKLLAFYPTSTPINRQVSIIGLWIALNEFSSSFDGNNNGATNTTHQNTTGVYAIETAQRHWVGMPLLQDQPHGITLLLLAPTALATTLDAQRAWLRRLHHALRITGALASPPDRSHALYQAVLDHIATHVPLPSAAHPTLPDAVPFVHPSTKTALSVQCLADSLLLHSISGLCPVQHVLIAHGPYCLYSSMGREDTAALHGCLGMALMGGGGAASSSTSGNSSPTDTAAGYGRGGGGVKGGLMCGYAV